jgi:serine/threonine-protein kinase HipA
MDLDDRRPALNDGLYEGDYMEKTYYEAGIYTGVSFVVFAEKAGISPILAGQVVDQVVRETPKAIELVQRSFLSEGAKSKYIEIIGQRQKNLRFI